MSDSTQIAKAALRRLALSKLEPTPDNYTRAYAQEAADAGRPLPEPGLPERAQGPLQRLLQLGVGDASERLQLSQALQAGRWDEAQRQLERLAVAEGPAAQGELLAGTLEALVRGLERGGRQWTLARKKDGLSRVLAANRGDGQRLLKRLRQLVGSWDSDATAGVEARQEEEGGTPSQFFDETEALAPQPVAAPDIDRISLPAAELPWPAVSAELHASLQTALLPAEADATAARARELADALKAAHQRLQDGDLDQAATLSRLAEQARRLLAHRRHGIEQMATLCRQLSGSLTDLAEDESWAQGQAQAVDEALAQGLSAFALRSIGERLDGVRERQRGLRQERAQARSALKGLVQTLLAELGRLNEHTDRFGHSLERYAEVIDKADSLESLTGLVREMVEDSRTVQGLVQATQGRLADEHARASQLSERVQQLEGELRRLAEEVHTDQLTRVANRRGLQQQFERERAALQRDASASQLAVALLDIDNFKKLNDSLGHAAGDEALRGLATRTQATLRPGDVVARYGGEEFVLLLPRTPIDEAVQVLNRLQRALSSSLFMHEGRDVFVTFSAGVTLHRDGETLDATLARADEALYEAKRSGKNRSCQA